LPNRVSLTAVTAPPPLNPRLQFCLERYVTTEFEARGSAIRNQIAAISALDLSYLPKKMRTDLVKSFAKATESFERLEAINKAEAAVAVAARAFRPLHSEVRDLQKTITKIDADLKSLASDVRRANDGTEQKGLDQDQIAALKLQRENLIASIPAEWEARNKTFAALIKAERTSRAVFRRTVDDAYKPVQEFVEIMSGFEALKANRDAVAALPDEIAGLELETAMDRIQEAERLVGDIPGTRDVKSLLSKARRSLRGKSPNPEEAAEFLGEAVEAYDADIAWRQQASQDLASKISAYEMSIRDTIGLRSQPRLERPQALYVARCSADHRDISLNF